MTVLQIIILIIGFLLLAAAVGYSVGYSNGSNDTIESCKDRFESIYALAEQQNEDWATTCNDINESWREKYSKAKEDYERQIKILNQMLEKERGKK